MIRASFPPPLSAYGDPKVEGTIHVDDVPMTGILLIAVTRTKNGRGAVASHVHLGDGHPAEYVCNLPAELSHDLIRQRDS